MTMTYERPLGAIKSRKELEKIIALVRAEELEIGLFKVRPHAAKPLRRMSLNKDTKLRNFEVTHRRPMAHTMLVLYNLSDVTSVNNDGVSYLFTNYFHAYAYNLRMQQNDKED